VKASEILQLPISQQEFAELIGVSEGAVSQMKSAGLIDPGAPGILWLHGYIYRLREQAAGRLGDDDAADLVTERAKLARSQREGQEIKNAVARGEYAAIALLSDVLADASAAVAEGIDQILAVLRRSCPDLPKAAIDTVMTEIARCRNEWARKTADLVAAQLEDSDQPVTDDDSADAGPIH